MSYEYSKGDAQLEVKDRPTEDAKPMDEAYSLIMSNLALDTIYLSKVKTIQNLGAVDMAMYSLVRMKRVFVGLLIFSIVALVLNLAIVAMTTYFGYKDVIDLVNDNMDQTYGAPGGFATAIAIRYPVLAKLMGFYNDSYPLALFFCLRDGSFNSIFQTNPGQYMATMWSETMQGGSCGIVYNVGIPTPIELICCTFYASNVPLYACDAPCNAYSSTSTPSIVSNSLNSAVSGAYLGMDVGGPYGAVAGAIISVGVSLGLTFGAKAGQTTPPCVS